jgi:hypothetical protein
MPAAIPIILPRLREGGTTKGPLVTAVVGDDASDKANATSFAD